MRVVDAVDADCKHREGPDCPDPLVVVSTKREFDDSGEWHQEASSSPIMLASSHMRQYIIIVAYEKMRS